MQSVPYRVATQRPEDSLNSLVTCADTALYTVEHKCQNQAALKHGLVIYGNFCKLHAGIAIKTTSELSIVSSIFGMQNLAN